MAFFWKCVSCGHATTIVESNHTEKHSDLWCRVTPTESGIRVGMLLIECPNTECQAQYLQITTSRGSIRRPRAAQDYVEPEAPVGLGAVVFLPTTPQPLSKYVPAAVQGDFQEAYLIREFSPKASATLARRALQGMVRDFFNVRKPTLHEELQAIKDRCDHELFDAMMGVKSVGNIGAHPEKDINLIVDIEPGEAQALLDLLHVLDQEWYVARAQRAERIAKVRQLGVDKREARTSMPGMAGEGGNPGSAE